MCSYNILGKCMAETPEQLLEYFEWMKTHHNDPKWEQGATLIAEWIALMQQEIVLEQEFRQLYDQIEAPLQAPGSGWFDLWLRVRHWGYHKGFAVTDHHHWDWDPDAFTCTEVGDYTGQITPGKQYARIREDTARQLLRVVNDQGKTRWYPIHLFERSVVPVQRWIRRPVM